jgi:4a-hydroxytetrahydrobiopterin dehydratase
MPAASDLASRACVPCKGGVAPLAGAELVALADELGAGWRVVEGRRLEKQFRFGNFVDALAFVNRVGELAEEQAHHPDVHLAWGRVRVEIWTHTIDGLSENDFIWAAKCEQLARA